MINLLGTGWLVAFRTLDQILTAGVAITAFSLLLYALTFNLRDRVARSFALILACVVVIYSAVAIASTASGSLSVDILLRIQWVGILLLPPGYLHFSDALLSTTGKPSRGRRRWAVRLTYLFSACLVPLLATNYLVGPLLNDTPPAPHLRPTLLTEAFTLYYGFMLILAAYNFARAYRRTLTRTSRRRMLYLLVGAAAPAVGSYPYLLFGSSLLGGHPIIFWMLSTFSSFMVGIMIVVMAYAVAFFGVPWPDRVVKSRLFKWLMRGPVTASLVLGITTIVRRAGALVGYEYSAAVPIIMVVSILVIEYAIILLAPVWVRLLFTGKDRADLSFLENLQDRLLTRNDLLQFLEVVMAAVCDRLQSPAAFAAALNGEGLELVVLTGDKTLLQPLDISGELNAVVLNAIGQQQLFRWGDFTLVPLKDDPSDVHPTDGQPSDSQLSDSPNEEKPAMLGLLGFYWKWDTDPDEEQMQALTLLSQRAAMALRDRQIQQQVFHSLQNLSPQVAMIQQISAAARYDRTAVLAHAEPPPDENFITWVKDALTHYWGGPKLTQSPLLQLKIVRNEAGEYEGNTANALRAILRKAIEQVKPEGERRFTAEWILYNILELKFLQGRKVREVAARLAMSEADLYRKQRVAIEAVARTVFEMEHQARQESVNMK